MQTITSDDVKKLFSEEGRDPKIIQHTRRKGNPYEVVSHPNSMDEPFRLVGTATKDVVTKAEVSEMLGRVPQSDSDFAEAAELIDKRENPG